VVLQLPERDVPFAVRFEREAVARQRQQAAEQARQIADMEAEDLPTEETPSESDDFEGFGGAGRAGDNNK
jgi:nitric oxide reductase activation protein